MPDTSRRGLFGWLAGGVAAAALPKAAIARLFTPAARAVPMSPLMVELSEITRKAFVPKIAAQIYTQNPILSWASRRSPNGTVWGPTTFIPIDALPVRLDSLKSFDWNGFDAPTPDA